MYLFDPLGYCMTLEDDAVNTISRSLAYEKNTSVESVATGFLLPIKFVNFDEYELITTIMKVIRKTT